MACCNVCYVCKLQHNSFSIPLASDGWSCTKSRTIPPVFDTQITSITTLVKTSPSIFVFTFDAATAAWTVTPETFRLMLSPLSRWCHYREIQGVSRSGDRNVSVYRVTAKNQQHSYLLYLCFQMFPLVYFNNQNRKQ